MALVLVLALSSVGAQGARAAPTLTTLGPAFPTGAWPVSGAFSAPRSDTSGPLFVTANLLGASVSMFSVSPAGVLTAAGSPAATGVRPSSVAISPDGRLVATANSGSSSVSMFTTDFDMLTPLGTATTGTAPSSVVFSPNGRLLATANSLGDSVSVFSVSEVGALTPVGAPTPTGEGPISVRFSPDGRLLVAANSDSASVSVFAVTPAGELTPVGSTPTGGRTASVAFSPDGRQLAVSTSMSDGAFPGPAITMFSVSPGGALASIGTRVATAELPSKMAFSPDGGFLAIASGTLREVFTYSVSSDGVLAPAGAARTAKGPTEVAFSHDGAFLATVNTDDASVSLFSVSPAGVLTPIGAPAPAAPGPCSVQFSPAGGLLATGNGSGSVSVFSLAADGNPTPAGSPTSIDGVPCSVSFSPDGRLLATANGHFASVSVFSVGPGGALSLADDVSVGGSTTVAFSPAADLLATASRSGTSVSMFAVSPDGHLSPAGSAETALSTAALAFRPDGRLLVTANDDLDTLSVFSVSASGSLTPVGSPMSTGGAPRSLAFTPDGGLLAMTDDDGVSVFAVSAAGVLTRVAPAASLPMADAVAFSPTGALLAVTSGFRFASPSNSTLSLFAVSATGRLTAVGAPTPIEGSPSAVAFSADGTLIANTNGRASTVSVHPLAAPSLDTAITSAPPGATPSTSATLGFEANYPSTLECRLDAAPFAPCSTPVSQAYARLAEGAHTFTVRATDLLGNVESSPASRSWTVDHTAPLAAALAQPANGASNLRASPAFAWLPTTDNLTGIDRYELWVDGVLRGEVPAGSCAATCSATPAAPLADGGHRWEVRAVDGAGNESVSPSRSFSVDAAPPGAFALVGPGDDAATTSRRPELSWQPALDAGIGLGGYDVVLDDRIAASGLSANATSFTPASDLDEGVHRWHVVARDLYGNERVSPTQRFTVDTTPPVAAVTAAPNPALTGRSITFDAGGSRDTGSGIARVEWDLDGDGALETDTGAGRTATRSYAEPGTYALQVRVTDRAGLSAVARIDQRVTRTGTSGELGISINGGARYTRSPKVTITATWPLFASQMLVSNDGGFALPATLPLSKQTPWTLDSSGAERSSRLVYVRFRRGLTTSETYIDDIILDESRPSVTSARVTRSRGARVPLLAIRARDRGLAGVASVQVTNDRRKPNARFRAYRPRLKLVKQRGSRRLNVARPLYVRVRDRAGNVSPWRTVKRTRVRSARGR